MTILVSDSFNRANSTTTLGSTDSYNGGTSKVWAVYNGTFGISNNQAYETVSTNNVGYATVDVGVADAKYTISLPVSANGTRLIFRANSTSFLTFAATSGTYQLYSYNNGTWTQLVDSGKAPANNDTIVISCQNTTITIAVNGTQVVNTTSTFNQTATQFGIGATNGPGNMASLRWDNLQIEDFNTGTTYSVSGTATGTSSLTTSEKVTQSASGTVQGTSSLSSSETIIQHSGTTYSGAGASQGTSSLTSSEMLVLGASGSSQGTSIISTNDNVIYVDFGNSQGTSSLSSSETFSQHGTTTYSASGVSQGSSTLTSNERIIYVASGTVQGISSLITNELITLVASGESDGHSTVIFIDKSNQIIGTVHLKGSRILSIELNGNQVLDINLKGVV